MSKYANLLVRSAEITDISNDGRNIDGRAFFFDKPSWVVDPGTPRYLEEFPRRSVETTLKMRSMRPVFKNHNYLSGSWAETTFEPDAEGLLFHARAADTEYGAKTLQEVVDGDLRGVSVGFRSLGRTLTRSDPRGMVTVRSQIAIEELSFAPAGMHEGAGVLAVRSSTTPLLDAVRRRKVLLTPW